MTRAEVLALQIELTAQGFGPLAPDGQYGPATAAAYQAYLDALDPRTPSLVPPAERPWWAKPALLSGAASVLAALAGLAGWRLDASLLGEVLSALAFLVPGAMALYAGAKGEAPLDTTSLAPGLRRMAPGGMETGQIPGDVPIPPATSGKGAWYRREVLGPGHRADPERLPVSPERPAADPRGHFSD